MVTSMHQDICCERVSRKLVPSPQHVKGMFNRKLQLLQCTVVVATCLHEQFS